MAPTAARRSALAVGGAARRPRPPQLSHRCQSADDGEKKAPELQYQIIDFNRRSTKAGDALIKALTKLAPTRYFFPLNSMPDLPQLDFVRGGFIDPAKFADLPARSRALQNEFRQSVADARKAGIMVAV